MFYDQADHEQNLAYHTYLILKYGLRRVLHVDLLRFESTSPLLALNYGAKLRLLYSVSDVVQPWRAELTQ